MGLFRRGLGISGKSGGPSAHRPPLVLASVRSRSFRTLPGSRLDGVAPFTAGQCVRERISGRRPSLRYSRVGYPAMRRGSGSFRRERDGHARTI